MAIRLAATLILVVPFQETFKILMMKRNANLKFMPGVHVFPGGSIDKHDEDSQWKSMIPNNNSLSHFSARIAAIRETFEESGILVANPQEKLQVIPVEELKKWRNKVHENASQFLTLCQTYQIYPDIHRLHEWSNWITPTIETKRFDTKFFLAICHNLQMESGIHDNQESVTTDWVTPNEVLEKSARKQMKIIPPQFYTMTELANIKTIKQLEIVARNRTIYPIQPEFVNEDTHTVIALPGDPLHPNGAHKPSDRHRLLTTFQGGHMNMILEKKLDPASKF